MQLELRLCGEIVEPEQLGQQTRSQTFDAGEAGMCVCQRTVSHSEAL